MKRIAIALIAALAIGVTPAQADGRGAWVIVDQYGNVVSAAMVCDVSQCGSTDTAFARAMLRGGERFVQQTAENPVTKNVAGIGDNTPGVSVSLTPDNVWKIERKTESATVITQFTFDAAAGDRINEKPYNPETTTAASVTKYQETDLYKTHISLIAALQKQIAELQALIESMKPRKKAKK